MARIEDARHPTWQQGYEVAHSLGLRRAVTMYEDNRRFVDSPKWSKYLAGFHKAINEMMYG